MNNCIFCKIVEGSIPNYTIWEDDSYIAFLSPYPNTEGFSVVIPKKHHGSYFAEVEETVVLKLIASARKVAKKIDSAFEDVGRTGLIFEGFGVDHLHVKLFPMHGTSNDKWKKHVSSIDTFFETYQGYISSHDSKPADSKELAKIANKIRKQ